MTRKDEEVVLETVKLGPSIAKYRFRFRGEQIAVDVDAAVWRADSAGALSMAVDAAVERALAMRAAKGAT